MLPSFSEPKRKEVPPLLYSDRAIEKITLNYWVDSSEVNQHVRMSLAKSMQKNAFKKLSASKLTGREYFRKFSS